MHEKVKHLFAQKTQRHNKLSLPPLSLLLQILFSINFSIRLFTINVTFDFLLIFSDSKFNYFILYFLARKNT